MDVKEQDKILGYIDQVEYLMEKIGFPEDYVSEVVVYANLLIASEEA